MGKIRGIHSSPGIYTKITDIQYSAQSLGVTTLGVVGETEKGPAFEPIFITKWDEFYDYFGGTNPAKFKDSKYPKYELPYIAKSYLKASEQMYVCRVLGLSGYNAGPAFIITVQVMPTSASTSEEIKEYPIAVLRSRGYYSGNRPSSTAVACGEPSEYDALTFMCDEIRISGYKDVNFYYCSDKKEDPEEIPFDVTEYNKGAFTIEAYKNGQEKPVGTYSVTLNPGAKDYIYNVLGTDANEGSAAVFVEELYDYMLDDLVNDNFKVTIKDGTAQYVKNANRQNTVVEVDDFVTKVPANLRKSDIGSKFIYDPELFASREALNRVVIGDDGTVQETPMKAGDVVNVKRYRLSADDTIDRYGYFIDHLRDKNGNEIDGQENEITAEKLSGTTDMSGVTYDNSALLKSTGQYIKYVSTSGNGRNRAVSEGSLKTVIDGFANYREQFRHAMTPWVVSSLLGSVDSPEVKKLFRFHTISDGNAANSQVKISIANILPDKGTFDVYIRAFDDTDANPLILESYKNVSMMPGSRKYLGYQIGTFDGEYETKSKYVLVEIVDNDMTRQAVPAGFLGYPVRDYSLAQLETAPFFSYNKVYNEEIKDRRQYFGLSDITGVDVDMLTYKGKDAYTEDYTKGYTPGFHLDARLSSEMATGLTVDGVSGIPFDSVAAVENSIGKKSPKIASEGDMEETIYENVKLRKFTLYPYGGFDGWDVYRGARTNTDEYKANLYLGRVSPQDTFSTIMDATVLALSGKTITSDYYAYLAGINQFENVERYPINLFATPGIDYVNNRLLVHDAIDMVENRMDTFYVTTTPDKPFGATDAVDDMFSSQDAADNLDDSEIDTYYAASYYPWVKYLDRDNNIYINLPATKDAVRIMANTDSKKYPWIAPAGLERGTVECAKMHFYAKLEDRDNVYDDRINPLISYSQDGVKIWGNKTLYICDATNPMNRINSVRLVLYMRKLIINATRGLIFEPNDATLKDEFESIVKPILDQIKSDRGITAYELKVSQTPEEMDQHELSCTLWVKPTPTLEYIEINFVVTPQGVEFDLA